MSDALDSPLVPPALREALRLAPDNSPLLLHAGETVLRRGGFAEAEVFFKRALALDRGNMTAQLGLASAFFQQGKTGPALVIVESLVEAPMPSPRTLLLHARLALHTGETRLAARQYARAISADPALADGMLETDLAPHLPGSAVGGAALDAFTDAPAEALSFDERKPQVTGEPAAESPGGANAQPPLTFADVAGMEKAKEEIRMRIILPLQHPDLFQAYGRRTGGALLLQGPPGCGKARLARAAAGEAQSAFLPLGIGDLLDLSSGQGEKTLASIFEHARAHSPCVLFFDDIDTLAADRSTPKAAGAQIVHQFLAELDQAQTLNDGLLVIAATHAPWHLDPALRRPGRFDRIVFVPPPDAAARAMILGQLLEGKPTGEIDYDVLVRHTEEFSGADLKAVVDIAVEKKLREALRSGKIQPVSARDLLDAIQRHTPSARDWLQTARNHALYANQSGLFDEILAYLKVSR